MRCTMAAADPSGPPLPSVAGCSAASRHPRLRRGASRRRPLAGCRRTRSSIDDVPSFSTHLSLCSAGFHQLHRSYEEIRLLHGHRSVVVASSGSTAHADPCRSPWVRALDIPPRPPPLPPRPRLDFGHRVRRHAHPTGPACTEVHFRSVLRFASGFFSTRPRGARAGASRRRIPACSCLWLAVATNSPREGLSPPIQCPCQAHLLNPASAPGGSKCRSAPRNGLSVSPRNEWKEGGKGIPYPQIIHDPRVRLSAKPQIP